MCTTRPFRVWSLSAAILVSTGKQIAIIFQFFFLLHALSCIYTQMIHYTRIIDVLSLHFACQITAFGLDDIIVHKWLHTSSQRRLCFVLASGHFPFMIFTLKFLIISRRHTFNQTSFVSFSFAVAYMTMLYFVRFFFLFKNGFWLVFSLTFPTLLVICSGCPQKMSLPVSVPWQKM